MIDLSNQVAFITGGSRGIGAATAKLLAQAGAKIVVNYAGNEKAAWELEKELKVNGFECLSLKGRIEKLADCKSMIQKTLKRFGRIDILVNSAGIWEYGAIGTMDENAWRRTIDINLTGVFNMTNLVVPVMKKQQYGRIVNIASTAGQRGEASYSHYAASKGGVISFTKSIASELIRDGIWVNCVAPGWVDTEMVAHVFKSRKRKKEIFNAIPRGRIATPEEIAGPVLFLVSGLSNHVVGEVMNVNGGSEMCG